LTLRGKKKKKGGGEGTSRKVGALGSSNSPARGEGGARMAPKPEEKEEKKERICPLSSEKKTCE